MTPARFRRYQDVAAVEHVDSTRQPREGGEVLRGTVAATSASYVRVRFEDGRTASFWQESGWTAWDGWFRWRIVPLCRCEKPILGEPVTDPDDPRREWCSEDCRDDEAQARYEQRYTAR
jgi:hypothetical protein